MQSEKREGERDTHRETGRADQREGLQAEAEMHPERKGMQRTTQLPREAERDTRTQRPAEREGDRGNRHGTTGGR